jgi:hypothetical protein
MSPPKYRQGERVVVLPERGNPSTRPGIYTITRVMPASPDGIQYRAKNEMDTHERVLQEAQLQRVSGVAPLTTAEGLRETARPTSGREQAHRKRQRHRARPSDFSFFLLNPRGRPHMHQSARDPHFAELKPESASDVD